VAGKFFWYELMTSDRPAAQAFYAEVVGWTLSPFGDPADPYMIVEAGGRGVGGIMTIPQEACAQGLQPCWVGYVHVGDVDAACAKLTEAGGKVHRPPEAIPTVGRFAVVADPQGAMFNLMQPEGEDMPPVPQGTVGRTDWHELHTTDWAKAFDFYRSQFGWSKTDAMDMGPMGTYQMFAMEPTPVSGECGNTAGAMFNNADAPHPFWAFYVHVDAIDAAVERIEKGGGTVVQGPMEVPGGMWVLNATDPQGAFFSLVASKR